jgi:hypothetical protein
MNEGGEEFHPVPFQGSFRRSLPACFVITVGIGVIELKADS